MQPAASNQRQEAADIHLAPDPGFVRRRRARWSQLKHFLRLWARSPFAPAGARRTDFDFGRGASCYVGKEHESHTEYRGRARGALGAIWFLQGINVLQGNFMTGQIRWAVYGGIAVAAGIVLLLAGNRRKNGKAGGGVSPTSPTPPLPRSNRRTVNGGSTPRELSGCRSAPPA